MRHVGTINFIDRDSGDEAALIVREGNGTIALGATLKENGDITVVFGVAECEQLIKALKAAIG